MNIHNIYFYGEISKIPKLMMNKKKKNHLELCSLFAHSHCIRAIVYLDFNTYHATGRFSRQKNRRYFFLENRI